MIIRRYNEIIVRWRADGFGCLTDMGKAVNKQASDWLRLKSTKDLISYYQKERGIPRIDLIQVVRGGDSSAVGTWANQNLCIDFASWCDVKFRATVIEWIREIMTNGFVDIRNLTPNEIILAQAQQLVNVERNHKELQQEVHRIEAVQQEQFEQLIEHDEKIEHIDDKVADVEAEMRRVVNPDGYYYTVMGYNQRYHRGRKLNRQVAINMGRMAARLCRESNIDIQQINDVRFGSVGSYPEEILQQVFGD